MAAAEDNEQDLGPTARKIILGRQLRKLREEAGITRNYAGQNIRGSHSKISRMELGDVSFKNIDVDDLLKMYGVSDPQEREQYVEFARRSSEPGWWRQYNDVMPKWLNHLVGLEEATNLIQAYELTFVNGLLQTEEYARNVVRRGKPEASDDDIEQRVAVRMRRQHLLQRADGPKVWAVLDESILHRPVGGARVMREQIERLLELSREQHVSLQVVPTALSGYAAETPFSILRFSDSQLPNIVYIEYRTDALYMEHRKHVEPHLRAFDRLMVDAHTPERTRQMLDKQRNELL